MSRGTELRRTRMKPAGKRRIPGASAAGLAFAQAVLEGEPRCVMCGSEVGPFEAHHAVEKQEIERIARYGLRLPTPEILALMYDPRVGVVLCDEEAPMRCHVRQTNAFDRVPGDRLPERVWLFVTTELGEPGLRALEIQHPGAREWFGGDR